MLARLKGKKRKKDIGVGEGILGKTRDQLFSVVQLACGQLINSFIWQLWRMKASNTRLAKASLKSTSCFRGPVIEMQQQSPSHPVHSRWPRGPFRNYQYWKCMVVDGSTGPGQFGGKDGWNVCEDESSLPLVSNVCVCVCVCVCARARACVRACVRVCVWNISQGGDTRPCLGALYKWCGM